MLITETVKLNERTFIHNYSDANFYIIRNDGIFFADAYDLPESKYTYTESNKELPEEEPDDRNN